ncbi:MAG: hypothetical protein JWP00_2210 [Chloroflexi bacterium]|nr:hypothetical protein [Chloroflexota bacterium]
MVYILWQATQLDQADLIQTFQRLKVVELVWQTFLLATFATAWAILLAAPWAWLVARTDVPGRTFFRLLGPLPLAVPPYVGALAYAALLTPGGILHTFLAQQAGVKTFQHPFPDLIHGLGGSAFVLGIFTSPYIFSNIYSALQRLDPSLEEAARSLGYGPWRVFWRVTFPMMRPALTAGGLLVFLYAWVDFGVVSLLRLSTFTTVIYNYLLAGFNLAASAGLCLLLMAVVWLVLLGQRYALGKAHYSQARSQPPVIIKLGIWRWFGLAFLVLAVTLTLVLPLGVLLYQVLRFSSFQAFINFLIAQLGYTGNTLLLALGSATLLIILTGVVGRLLWRKPRDRSARFTENVLQAGYAIPGTVLGLSLVGLSINLFPALYGTPFVVLFAYVVLFAAPALQSVKAALAGISPTLEEAAQSLGDGPLRTSLRVTIPLAWPGLVGSWLLVFMLSLRELAATLIVRPPGYDTLAVRIWVHTSDVGPDPGSAVVALLLIAVAGLSWILILFMGKLQVRGFHGTTRPK